MSKDQDPFASFFQAGFECSSHRRRDGVRLDLIRATVHDRHVARRLSAVRGARLRHDPRRPALAPDRDSRRAHTTGRAGCRRSRRRSRSACRSSGTCSTTARPITSTRRADDFPERFTDFALAALEVQQSVSGRPPLVCPLNEINFLSWAVEDGYFPRVGPERARLVQAPAGADRDRGGASDQAAAGRTRRSCGPSR